MATTTVTIAVALIAKAPVAGKAKTRFCPPCTPDQAAQFATAFLRDTATLVQSLDVDAWCAYLGNEDDLRSIIGDNFQLLAQRGTALDDRLANVAEDLFAKGYERVVVLGADCPTVTQMYLLDSIDHLETHDVVIGPANDGGYVLLAQRVENRHLYEGIEMSTEFVYKETVERALDACYLVKEMSVLHDLDTAAELVAAYEAGQLGHALNTLEALRTIDCVPLQHQ